MAKKKLRMGDVLATMPPKRDGLAWLHELDVDAKEDLLATRKALQEGRLPRSKMDILRAAKSLYNIRCGKTRFIEWLAEKDAE